MKHLLLSDYYELLLSIPYSLYYLMFGCFLPLLKPYQKYQRIILESWVSNVIARVWVRWFTVKWNSILLKFIMSNSSRENSSHSLLASSFAIHSSPLLNIKICSDVLLDSFGCYNRLNLHIFYFILVEKRTSSSPPCHVKWKKQKIPSKI